MNYHTLCPQVCGIKEAKKKIPQPLLFKKKGYLYLSVWLGYGNYHTQHLCLWKLCRRTESTAAPLKGRFVYRCLAVYANPAQMQNPSLWHKKKKRKKNSALLLKKEDCICQLDWDVGTHAVPRLWKFLQWRWGLAGGSCTEQPNRATSKRAWLPCGSFEVGRIETLGSTGARLTNIIGNIRQGFLTFVTKQSFPSPQRILRALKINMRWRRWFTIYPSATKMTITIIDGNTYTNYPTAGFRTWQTLVPLSQ